VKLLLENGADVKARDFEGRTALKLAEDNGHKEVVEMLKEYGASD